MLNCKYFLTLVVIAVVFVVSDDDEDDDDDDDDGDDDNHDNDDDGKGDGADNGKISPLIVSVKSNMWLFRSFARSRVNGMKEHWPNRSVFLSYNLHLQIGVVWGCISLEAT